MKAPGRCLAALVTGGLLSSFGISLADEPVDPVVSIEATRRIAEETAAPLRRINLVGEFTVSRTGATDSPLPVWIHVSGSATPGVDYEALPWLVTIPAGESSTSFPVTAFYDRIPEGIETVIAQVSNCPPPTDPPLGAPCYGFGIDPAKDRDTVFIREDGLTVATVHITQPESGDRFAVGEPIAIQAVAIHLKSYISRVEFWADGSLIDVSEIYFVRPPDPGTPIHHQVEWLKAPPGDHVLKARARTLDGLSIVSTPVRITVGEGEPNKPPEVAIVSPSDGDEFPAGDPVPIMVETRDPDGYVPRMEFFADGMKIGERNIYFFAEPPPGQLQTFRFVWRDPMPGRHVLTARATDNDRTRAESAPVTIVVAPGDPVPAVCVVARDAFAVEPSATGALNTATFRIGRFGMLQGELTVRYSMHGRAENGVDYETLSGTAVIPEGSAWTDVVVTPLADSEEEKLESVILRLEENTAYRIGHRRRAFAVISDRPWVHPHPHGRPHCKRLEDGLVHLCFPRLSGQISRLEGSGNLRDWSTLSDLVADDGAVHVVDEVTPGSGVSFRRIVTGP